MLLQLKKKTQKKKTQKKKKKLYFLRLLFAFTNIFLFNDGLKLSKVRNDLLEKMNQMFQKTRTFNKFSWEQKRRVKRFFYCKRIWKIQENIKLRFIQ